MTKNKLPKVIVVIGPTATNKTKLAIFLAQKLNGEIVNADAFQVYKELNIGVNKPTTKELKQAQFHLLSCVSIYDEWDIKRFQDEAKTTIDDIFARHKIPIIVGGSHLYVNALIQNYDLTRVPKRDQKYAHLTTPELYNMLLTRDSDRAQKIGPHNQQRLVRALQIFDYPPTTNKLPIYDPLFISCIRPRPSLYAHINQRVLVMLKKDWIDEIKLLWQKDKSLMNLQAFKAIGYREILQALVHARPVPTTLIQQKTRQFAKRQITWIKHHYVNPLVYNQRNKTQILNQVLKWSKDN